MDANNISLKVDSMISSKDFYGAYNFVCQYYKENPDHFFLDARLYDCYENLHGEVKAHELPRLLEQGNILNNLIIKTQKGELANENNISYGPYRAFKSFLGEYLFYFRDDIVSNIRTLTSHGLSEKFIEQISKEENLFQDQQHYLKNARLTVAELDVFDAIDGQGKIYLCPFTGDLKRAKVNLWIDVFNCPATHDKTSSLILFNLKNGWCGTEPSLLYFLPEKKICIFTGTAKSKKYIIQKIAEFSAIAARNFDIMSKHVVSMRTTTNTPIGLVDFRCGHIGHTLWNILPGKFHALSHKSSKLSYVLEWKENTTFGAANVLFKEFFNKKLIYKLIDNEKSFFEILYKSQALLLTPVSNYIDCDLVKNISEFSYKESSQAFKKNILNKTKNKTPIVLVSLRCGNREWVNQDRELSLLLSKILGIYPSALFLIDGITCDNSNISTHRDIDASKEAAVFDTISENIPHESLLDCTNIPMSESILACTLCDFYIAPIGSGMVKFRWIANKPGVAFSNEFVLKSLSKTHPLGVWDNEDFRAGIVPARYISPKHVTSDENQRGLRASFMLSHESIFNELQAVNFFQHDVTEKPF